MVDDVEFRSHVIIVQTLFDTHLHQSMRPEHPELRQEKEEEEIKNKMYQIIKKNNNGKLETLGKIIINRVNCY